MCVYNLTLAYDMECTHFIAHIFHPSPQVTSDAHSHALMLHPHSSSDRVFLCLCSRMDPNLAVLSESLNLSSRTCGKHDVANMKISSQVVIVKMLP